MFLFRRVIILSVLAAATAYELPQRLSGFPSRRALTCDDASSVQILSCDAGVIFVQAALYGRTNKETCSTGRPRGQLENTRCSQKGTVDILKKRCDGKTVCELNTSLVRTSDPCAGIFKYLETKYTCIPAHRVVACEFSEIHLQCAVNQIIFVYGADYGRLDQTTCAYKRPTSQFQKADCSRPSPEVANRCNGENSCTVSASNSVFGDPCPGTYKYLQVAYTCFYPE